MLKKLLAFTLITFSAMGSFAGNTKPKFDLPNLGQVNENIWRGGRPDQAGIWELSRKGIKTIINLESNDKAVANEKKWAQDAKINFISIQLSTISTPRDEDIELILQKLNDPSLFPIFIHCLRGSDRTGLVLGLYRFFYEHWESEDAYQEMLDYGFLRLWRNLDRYYKEKTNYPSRWSWSENQIMDQAAAN